VASLRGAAAATALAVVGLLWTPAQATPTWLPPETISGEDQSLFLRDVVIAPNGTQHAVMVANPSLILYSSIRRPGGQWQYPAPMASRAFDGSSRLELVVDSASNVHIVWVELVNSTYRVVYARRGTTGGWSNPVRLSAVGPNSREATVGVDRAGTVTVAWARDDEGDTRVQVRRKPAGGSWGAVKNVSSSENQVDSPDVAVDPQGRATVVWRQGVEPNWSVWATQRDLQGIWSAPEELSTPGYTITPLAAAEADGDVSAVWLRGETGGYVVQAARKPAGSPWQDDGTTMSEVGKNAGFLVLALGNDGHGVVAWSLQGPAYTVVQARTRTPSSGWSATESLGQDTDTTSAHDVAVGRQGNVWATWVRYNDGVILQRRQHLPGSGWSATADIPGSEDRSDTRVSVDAGGNVLVGWWGGSPTFTSAATGYDAEGPRVRVTAPGPTFSLTAPTVRWHGFDVFSDVTEYSVRIAVAKAQGAFAAPATWRASTAAMSGRYTDAAPGSTYCFSARGTDAVGNTGLFSTARCTAIPLNDRALDAAGGWHRETASGAYRGTFTRASVEGADLRSPNVQARRIALIATRAPGAGAVKVFFAGDLLKTVSLKPTAAQNSTKTYRKQVIPIAVFGSRRQGVVKIVTVSNADVAIEGLGISAK
jgi:hypothetical protein